VGQKAIYKNDVLGVKMHFQAELGVRWQHYSDPETYRTQLLPWQYNEAREDDPLRIHAANRLDPRNPNSLPAKAKLLVPPVEIPPWDSTTTDIMGPLLWRDGRSIR
jgi:hypothetical protein